MDVWRAEHSSAAVRARMLRLLRFHAGRVRTLTASASGARGELVRTRSWDSGTERA